MIKLLKNQANLIYGIILSIVGVILVFLLQYNIISSYFSAIFVIIGAGLTATFNDYIQKRTEERAETKLVQINTVEINKLWSAVNSLLDYNLRVSDLNIKSIERNKTISHIPFLKTGFWELVTFQMPFDTIGESRISYLMIINMYIEEMNKLNQLRENYIISKEDDVIDPVIKKFNQRLLDGYSQLIKNINEFKNEKY